MAFYCQWPIKSFTEILVSLAFASNVLVNNSSRRSSSCLRTISLDVRDYLFAGSCMHPLHDKHKHTATVAQWVRALVDQIWFLRRCPCLILLFLSMKCSCFSICCQDPSLLQFQHYVLSPNRIASFDITLLIPPTHARTFVNFELFF